MNLLQSTRASARALVVSLCPFVLLAGALAPVPAAAYDRDGTEPIVVTASRIEQPLGEALPSTTVITRADIERSQAQDLAELLSRQPGFEMARTGAQGAQTSLFLRGANSNQVLVLIDGVPLNSAVDAAPFLGSLSTDNVERIEIARGNLSSLYGSSAIGGVVQIFTRSGTQSGVHALAEAGQGHTRDANVSATTPLAGGWINVLAGLRTQDAVSAINAAQVPQVNPDINGNRARNEALRWDRHEKDYSLAAWIWDNHSDTSLDDPSNYSVGVPSTSATQAEFRVQRGTGLSGSMVLGNSQLRVMAAQAEDNDDGISSIPNSQALADQNNYSYRSRTRLYSLQDQTTLFHNVELNVGAEFQQQRAGSSEFDPTGNNAVMTYFSRHSDSFWVGNSGHLGTQQWQLNVRHDQYSDFGGATTGLAGWGWNFVPDWKLTAQVSNAFRAPSLQDLYAPFSGNPALRPEHARSQEVGLRWSRGPWNAGLSVYRSRVADLILFGPPPTFQSVNIAQAAMNGSEWQFGAALGAWHLGASLSLDHARQLEPTYAELARRAHYNARISAEYASGRWTWSTQAQRTGSRSDAFFNPVTYAKIPEILPSYNLARIALSYAAYPGIQLRLRVENLFNANYQSVYSYNALPRMIIGGIEAKF